MFFSSHNKKEKQIKKIYNLNQINIFCAPLINKHILLYYITSITQDGPHSVYNNI